MNNSSLSKIAFRKIVQQLALMASGNLPVCWFLFAWIVFHSERNAFSGEFVSHKKRQYYYHDNVHGDWILSLQLSFCKTINSMYESLKDSKKKPNTARNKSAICYDLKLERNRSHRNVLAYRLPFRWLFSVSRRHSIKIMRNLVQKHRSLLTS